jgi:hypothetical protein
MLGRSARGVLFVALLIGVLTVDPVSALSASGHRYLIAGMTANTHRPKAGERWPIAITARDDRGHPVCGHVRYAIMSNGQVVARRTPPRPNFCGGRFHDRSSRWPHKAIGYVLTFRAVVDTKIGQANLDYLVRVVA